MNFNFFCLFSYVYLHYFLNGCSRDYSIHPYIFCSLFRGTIVPLHGKCRNFNHTYLYIPSVFLKMLLGSYVVFSFLFSSRNFLSDSLFLFFFFLFGCSCLACGILVSKIEIEPVSGEVKWELRVLTTGLPGNSQESFFF